MHSTSVTLPSCLDFGDLVSFEKQIILGKTTKYTSSTSMEILPIEPLLVVS